MEVVRVVLAIILFFISSYLVYDLIANGFDFFVLIVCVTGFILVHYILPRNKIEDNAWYDILELIIDIPFRAFAFSLRSIGRVFRGSDGGIDFDL